MIVYHGTNQTSANAILKKIDVSLGGGELGKGFYAGENISLAASLSKGKFGNIGKVIKLDINESEYVKLNIKTLNGRQFLIRLWKSLIRRKRTFQHVFNVDVVCAPFATIDFSYQYKFESTDAENVLNNFTTKLIL